MKESVEYPPPSSSTHLDDATTSPHGGDTGIVQSPVIDLGSLTHEHKALRVRDDLRSVKSLLEVTIYRQLAY